MDKEKVKTNNNIFAELFLNLDENAKAKFCKKVQKCDSKIFSGWMKKSGLGKGGFTPKTIAAREKDYFRKRLDETIVKPENHRLLEELVKIYFLKCNTELFDKYSSYIKEISDDINPRVVDSALKKIQKEYEADPLLNLFEAFINKKTSEYIKETPEKKEEEYNKLIEGLDKVQSILDELEKQYKRIEKSIQPLKSVNNLKREKVEREIDAAENLVTEIKNILNLIAEKVDYKKGEWKSKKELEDYINDLGSHILNHLESENNRLKIESIMHHLLGTEIAHRSNKQENLLREQKELILEELNALLEKESIPSLPGPDKNVKWLSWALNLENEELEETQKILKEISPALAEFIGICEQNWIKKKTGKKIKKKTVEGDNEESLLKEIPKDEISEQGAAEEPVIDEKSGILDKEENIVPTQEKKPTDSEPVKEKKNLKEEETFYKDIYEWDKKKLSEISEIINKDNKFENKTAFQSLVSKYIESGHLSLAYNTVSILENLNEKENSALPAWIIKVLILGKKISFGSHDFIIPIKNAFMNFREDYISDGSNPWKQGLNLILAAGTLRPSIFAPVTGAASVLGSLRLHKFSELSTIINSIVEFGNIGKPLPPYILRKDQNISDWKQDVNELSEEVRDWLTKCKTFEIISRPAKAVWRDWVSKKGPINNLLTPVIQSNFKRAGEVRGIIENWGSDIEKEAKQTHRNLGHRGELVTPALKQIKRHASQAIEFASQWLQLHESKPGERKSYDEKLVGKLRNSFHAHYHNAADELTDLIEGKHFSFLKASANECKNVIDGMNTLLSEGKIEKDSRESNIKSYLNRDLLLIPDIILDSDWRPKNSELTQLELILSQTEKGIPTLKDAFNIHSKLGNHEASQRIIEIFKEDEKENKIVAELNTLRNDYLKKDQKGIIKSINEKRMKLAEGLNKGLIEAVEFENLSADLAAYEQKVKDKSQKFLRFNEIRNIFEEIDRKLGKRLKDEADKIKNKLEKIDGEAEDKRRINNLLDNGDIYTATDYTERLEQGKPLTEKRDEYYGNSFRELFELDSGESKYTKLEKNLAQIRKPQDIVNAVSRGRNVLGLDMREVPGTEARQLSKLLSVWLSIKSKKEITAPEADYLLRGLGFRPQPDGVRIESKGRTWINVQSDTIEDVSPVSQFGSDVNGRYRILCEWKIPNEEDLISAFSNFNFDAGRMVFYFGRLTAARRRKLARLCRKKRISFIVLDDILLIFLSTKRGAKLRLLFECSLPFTHISPYSMSSSLLPPEMFYGRRRQIEALMTRDASGSCLLYGGRQIGKTVLLRHVERLFNQDPEQKRVARFVDLKVQGIGSARPLDEIWKIIAQELAQIKLIDENKIPAQVSPDWLFKEIQKWLDDDSRRRVLILLDEADLFLESDGKPTEKRNEPFSRCARIRGFMEETKRRFKVVFSGLHNVQRATQVANNPLAQYGEPLCIGPMLSAGESREAEKLIKKPLSSLGYYFESPDLVARILAQTNYYPNLIQIYCHNLLNYLAERGDTLFNENTTPPFIITSKMINDVYERHELRNALSDRFNLTLNLDSRFKLIAHILAYNDNKSEEGFAADWIRKEAADWWKEGFIESNEAGRLISDSSFRNLLDEMVGLGILRRTEKTDHYSLRSPNVVTLLGSISQIEEVLLSCDKWDPPTEYEATTFRGVLDQEFKLRRSPLTASQENELKRNENQVVILFGCEASKISDVPEAINHRFGSDHVNHVKKASCLDDFKKNLDQLSSRSKEGTTVMLIPSELPWDNEWVQSAFKRSGKFRNPKAYVTILFLADPKKTFEFLSYKDKFSNQDIRFMYLHPWTDEAVRQWFEDSPLGPQNHEVREKIEHRTGNWPLLLYEIPELTDSGPFRESTLDELEKKLFLETESLSKYRKAFGFDCRDCLYPLKTLAELDELCDPKEIAPFLEEIPQDQRLPLVKKSLKWAKLLSLVDDRPDGWMIDPIVKRFLLREK